MRLTAQISSTAAAASRDARRLPRALTLIGVCAVFLLVFELDRTTGLSPVQHLYYIPIVAAAVRFGMLGGVLSACVAIVLYHSANPHLLTFRYEESDFMQIAVFIAAGVLTAKLTNDARRLRLMAMTDDLTGLHNLRSFEMRLAALIRASRDTRTPLAMFVLDVDQLKALNDVHGHLTGAEAVRTVGGIIAAHVPPEAVACRYGGDEFAIVVPRCTLPQATALADELRRSVHDAAPLLAAVAFPAGTLSVSVGVACAPSTLELSTRSDAEYGEALFRQADAALFRAKQGGRNQICLA